MQNRRKSKKCSNSNILTLYKAFVTLFYALQKNYADSKLAIMRMSMFVFFCSLVIMVYFKNNFQMKCKNKINASIGKKLIINMRETSDEHLKHKQTQL